jgi:hypothetical protein
MTDVGLVPRRGQPPESAGLTAEPPLTLSEEHVLLLWQVTARTEELLTAVAHGRWPAAELTALADYARDFAAQLEPHLKAEENLLEAGRAAQRVPGTAALGGHPHE